MVMTVSTKRRNDKGDKFSLPIGSGLVEDIFNLILAALGFLARINGTDRRHRQDGDPHRHAGEPEQAQTFQHTAAGWCAAGAFGHKHGDNPALSVAQAVYVTSLRPPIPDRIRPMHSSRSAVAGSANR